MLTFSQWLNLRRKLAQIYTHSFPDDNFKKQIQWLARAIIRLKIWFRKECRFDPDRPHQASRAQRPKPARQSPKGDDGLSPRALRPAQPLLRQLERRHHHRDARRARFQLKINGP
jgi:hypothetical protein